MTGYDRFSMILIHKPMDQQGGRRLESHSIFNVDEENRVPTGRESIHYAGQPFRRFHLVVGVRLPEEGEPVRRRGAASGILARWYVVTVDPMPARSRGLSTTSPIFSSPCPIVLKRIDF